jgi:hypothetical protein
MSYREKNITAELVSFGLLFLYYVINWLNMYRTAGLVSSTIFRLWGIVIVAGIFLTILFIILTHIGTNIVSAIKTGKESTEPMIEDERDKLIELKGEYVAYITGSFGIFLAMLTFALGQPPLLMFSLIVFFCLIAQLSGGIAQLVYYRKGV